MVKRLSDCGRLILPSLRSEGLNVGLWLIVSGIESKLLSRTVTDVSAVRLQHGCSSEKHSPVEGNPRCSCMFDMNLFLMKCEIYVLHKAAWWKHKGEKTQKALFALLMELQGKYKK